MPEDKTIDQRLTAVEQELSRLKESVGANGSHGQWLERFVGAFQDDPAFDEATQLAEEYRRSQHPESHG
jgi:hypothetical protein